MSSWVRCRQRSWCRTQSAKQFIGYSLLTHLLYRAGLDYRSLLLVINLLMTGVVLWFVKRYSPLPWMSLFFYLTLQFFAHSMNLFRQSIAATICLLAYPFLKKRKLLPFALVVLLAAAFHTSALFFLPFYWILNWKCDGRLLGGLAMAAVPVYLFSNQAAQLLTQYLFPNYAGYIGSRYWAGLGYRYAIFPILYFGSGMADPALAACRGARKSHFNQQLLLCDVVVCL